MQIFSIITCVSINFQNHRYSSFFQQYYVQFYWYRKNISPIDQTRNNKNNITIAITVPFSCPIRASSTPKRHVPFHHRCTANCVCHCLWHSRWQSSWVVPRFESRWTCTRNFFPGFKQQESALRIIAGLRQFFVSLLFCFGCSYL